MPVTPYLGLGGIAYGSLATYGTLKLTETSPPQSFVEPFTLAEAKAFLVLPQRSPVDDGEDALISAMISAARVVAEIMQGRDLVEKQFDLALDYFTTYQIRLRSQLKSVELVQYRYSDGHAATLTENVDYLVDAGKDPGIITPMWNHVWPTFTAWPSSAVLVRFTAGMSPSSAWWSDTGYHVRLGMKQLISAWFNNRLPFEIGAGASGVDEYPYTVTSLLSFGGVKAAR